MMFDFSNKNVVVFGAGTGIGRSVAISFGKAGANVACISKTSKNCLDTAVEIGSNAFSYSCDISKYDSVISAMSHIFSKFNQIDVLVNTAGINIMQNSHEASIDTFNKIIETNLNGSFYTSKLAIDSMLRKKNHGCIINTASAAAFKSLPWSAAYSASKAGLVQMTKSMAYEYRDKNIRINAVAPGAVDTPFISKQTLPEDADYNLVAPFAIRSGLGDPDDIAFMYLYLASEKAKFINGSILSIDGGVVC